MPWGYLWGQKDWVTCDPDNDWLTKLTFNCFFLTHHYLNNRWPNPDGPISNPLALKEIYVAKYFGDLIYFSSHTILDIAR